MADLKYYRDENARWPTVHEAEHTVFEARVAIDRLQRHFKVGGGAIDLEWTSGGRIPKANNRRILLNLSFPRWLTLLHEFAHVWQGRRRNAEFQDALAADRERRAADPTSTASRGELDRAFLLAYPRELAHGRRHARLVDRAVRYALRCGWIDGSIERAVRERSERLRALAIARREARGPVEDPRIVRRRAQVARLESRIKSLSTRLSRAKRSLAALERARDRKPAPAIRAAAGPSGAQEPMERRVS